MRDHQDALLGRRIARDHRGCDRRELRANPFLLVVVARDLGVDVADGRFELVKPITRLVRREELGLEVRRTHSLIYGAAVPDLEAVACAAVHIDARGVTLAIRVEIRLHAVLGALLAIGRDRRLGAAERAVFEADGAPIPRETSLLAHAGAARESEQHGRNGHRTNTGCAKHNEHPWAGIAAAV